MSAAVLTQSLRKEFKFILMCLGLRGYIILKTLTQH